MKQPIAPISTRFMPGNQEIVNLRPQRNTLNPEIPYHFLHETEPDTKGVLQKVNTIFLTAKECSFKCTMCDLWKNTLAGPTPKGAIFRQIDYATTRLPEAEIIKLYNNGNFFDPKAIPPSDHQQIVERLKPYTRVIVENHPTLTNKNCLAFKAKLNAKLEIAMGLETIHPDVLPKLNKQLTPEDFKKAAEFLTANDIDVRAFILLNPPYLTGQKENIEWVSKTVEFAFESGTQCCSIIATRSGNGIMQELAKQGLYTPPTLDALEQVFETALQLKQGRVFVDTWDIGFLSTCPDCFQARKERLEAMNLNQKTYPPITCQHHDQQEPL
jgi:archaeosine synthase beta-subunit